MYNEDFNNGILSALFCLKCTIFIEEYKNVTLSDFKLKTKNTQNYNN